MPFLTNNTNQNSQNNNLQNNNMVVSHVQEEQLNELNQLLDYIDNSLNNANENQNTGAVNGAATGEDEHILSVANQASDMFSDEVYANDGKVYKLEDLLNDNYYYDALS